MTSPRPDPSLSLAQLASESAGASRVFARHGLDFCCGGRIRLEEACARRGLDLETVLDELAAQLRSDEPVENWRTAPLPLLVEHVITRFHVPLRSELPRLVAMARRVERAHVGKASCPVGLADLLESWGENLLSHLATEEELLFPLVRQGGGAGHVAMIHALEAEHDEHARVLAAIRDLTDDHTPPPEACGTWRALYVSLAEFELELMRHVHLENHVLFPRVMQDSGVT